MEVFVPFSDATVGTPRKCIPGSSMTETGFQLVTDDQNETDRYWKAIVGNGSQDSA